MRQLLAMKNTSQKTKQYIAILWIIFLFISLSACQYKGTQKELGIPKYVFLFIGDGMGLSQIHAAEIMQGALNGEEIDIQKLSFSSFPGTGFMTTFSSNSYITDSAAAGTAMASGHKTINGRINIDRTNKFEYKTIAEMAKEKGIKIGIISNVPLNHATPACFYARVSHRHQYYEIAQQMVESGFDFFGGGGIQYPSGRRGLQADILKLAEQKGYRVIRTKNDFLLLGEENRNEKIIALNEKLTLKKAMPYCIDTRDDDLSLADYVNKSIELIDNDKGFFMMVEGGKIDWAAHDHDAATMIKEVREFDKAVLRAVQFYNEHPEETLIVVTADHETGGMTLGSDFTGYSLSLEILNEQAISLEQFNQEYMRVYDDEIDKREQRTDDFMPLLQEKFGLKRILEKEEKELRNSYEDSKDLLFGLTVVEILNRKAGISWTTGAHTAVPLPVFSCGKDYEYFVGYYDNTDLFEKLTQVMSLSQSP